MDGFTSNRRKMRMLNREGLVSQRTYNLTLIGTLFYGLIVNVILCLLVGDVTRYISPLAFLVLYFISAFAGTMISARSNNPLISFLGYNMVVVPIGLVISMTVEMYSSMSPDVVFQAFVLTACVTGGMAFVGIYNPELCSQLGGILFGCLFGLLIANVVIWIFGIHTMANSWFGMFLFSMYIAYDVYRSQQFPPTINNAIGCALDIYLDIANLFLDILRILGNKNSRNN